MVFTLIKGEVEETFMKRTGEKKIFNVTKTFLDKVFSKFYVWKIKNSEYILNDFKKYNLIIKFYLEISLILNILKK